MPDKLYQECRALMKGARAIFQDLQDLGVDTIAVPGVSSPDKHALAATSLQDENGVPGLSLPESLADIQREAVDCQRCGLSAGRKQVVFGTGNPQARLVLIGEAPGAQEDSLGEPFVGEAGQLLDRILFAMKLRREDVYICNLIKCRAPKNRDPDNKEIGACEVYLKRQLVAIAPEMILCLGRFAAQTLLGSSEPLSKLRGHWYSYEGIALMPTFHPAYLLSNPAGKRQVWEDLKQVMHRLREGTGN